MKKIICLLLAVCHLAIAAPVTAADAGADVPSPASSNETTVGLGVESHTREEIKAFFEAYPADAADAVEYSLEPSLSLPYSPGVLSDATTESALNMLNQLRYIAGLSSNVAVSESKTRAAEAATLVNYLNNSMSHYPVRPEVLSGSEYDSLYELGYNGASGSNIAWGYSTLNMAMLRGWFADEDASNISRVGHRRWLLNPFLETVGFGVTGSHSAVYVQGESFWRDWGGRYVAWPAQQMPVQYFAANYPWSLSLGNAVPEDTTTVTLVRRGDGRTWHFSSSSSDGDFYINNAGYGSPSCIIFRPNDLSGIAENDVFDVTVRIDDRGDVKNIVWSVGFFDLDNIASDGSCPGHVYEFVENNGGVATLRCAVCGAERLVGTFTDMSVWWNDDGSNLYRSGVATERRIKDSLNAWIQGSDQPDGFKLDSSFTVEISDESVMSYTMTSNNSNNQFGYFTALAPGEVTVTFYPRYNPDLRTSITFTVICTHDSVKLVGAKDAACSQEGYMGDLVCEECGEIIKAGEVIPKTAHNYIDGVCSECGAEKPDTRPGDVNGDGEITNEDALMLFLHIFDPATYPLDTEIADVSGDGYITNDDVLMIFRYIFDESAYPLG